MEFYIVDTTVNPPKEAKFHHYSSVIDYFEQMSLRLYKQNKRQRTILLEELGYGTEDRECTLFVRSMQSQFDSGVLRDGRKTRCDLTTIMAYQKPEFGD